MNLVRSSALSQLTYTRMRPTLWTRDACPLTLMLGRFSEGVEVVGTPKLQQISAVVSVRVETRLLFLSHSATSRTVQISDFSKSLPSHHTIPSTITPLRHARGCSFERVFSAPTGPYFHTFLDFLLPFI